MSYLLHVVLAIVVVSIAESGWTTGWRAPLVVPFLAGLAYVPAVLARLAALRGRFRAAQRYDRLLGLFPVGAFAAAVLVLGWYETTVGWLGVEPGLNAWPHPALFVVLAPFVLYALVAIDARARSLEGRRDEVRRQRRFHTRMLLAALAPFGLFVVATWALGTSEPVRVHIEEVGAFGAAFALLLLLSFVLLLPYLLTAAWSTHPLPAGPVRDVLERVAARAGFRCRNLYVWDTDHLVTNAAIVGLVPRGRAVLFSDALLSMLDLRELIAVFGHEVGHAKRRHVLVFIAWAVAVMLGYDLMIGTIAPQSPSALALWSLPLLAVGVFGFRWMSRRFELDADLYATEVTGDPEALASALLRVGGPHGMSKSSWRHFSTEKRLTFLRTVASDARSRRAFRRRLAWVSGLVAALFVAAAVGQAWYLAGSWHEGHLIAELRLGRYAEAGARLERLDDPDAGLERVVGAVRALGTGVSVELTEEAALAALRAGEVQRAADLVEVLCLRGRPLEWVLPALESDEAPSAAPGRDERWLSALRRTARS